MKSVGILTLGCKVNTYESEYIRNILEKNGYVIKDFKDTCDIYIINTCTVTNSSDSKSKKMIRQAKRNNPHACIVAMGCFIEANKDNLFEGINIVIGNKDKNKIVELLDEYYKNKNQIIRLYKDELNEFEDMYIDTFPGRTRAFVKIQDGCENYCSFCIIPFVRGACRSKDKDVVLDEINDLVNNGYKEIVLTGIHTGNYGYDKDYNFYDLLKEIVKIRGLKRLRISSIEMNELTDDILNLIKDNNIIVDHFHIPLQSGSDKILKAMRRKYNLNQYKNKIEEIRKIRKDVSITTDIIVGFPGETDKDFEDTYNFAKEIGFSKIHVFPYSERKGTHASTLDNKVDPTTKKNRAKKLIELSNELEAGFAKKFIGKDLEVLIEKVDSKSTGHTTNYLKVEINSKLKQNELYNVHIIDIKDNILIGELCI